MINKKKIKTRIIDAGAVLIMIIIFVIISYGYFGTSSETVIQENPRYVNTQYESLEKEAKSLVIQNDDPDKKANNVFVLTYHVITKDEPQDDYEISYTQFKNNMFTLKSLGYQTITLDQFYQFMRGEIELPDKSFILTFDDGARMAYYNGDAILKALNYTAVMFIITGQSLEENRSVYYLNETELREVAKTGRWELQSHTHVSHFRVPITESGDIAPALTNKEWLSNEKRLETDEEFFERVSTDLSQSKNLLQSRLNITAKSFALPYGDFGERGSNYDGAQKIVYNLTTHNYDMIFYEFPLKKRLYKGNFQEGPKDNFLISRFAADKYRTPETLVHRIESSETIDLPYHEKLQNYDRWVKLSGKTSFHDNNLIFTLGSSSPDSNLFAYLDGSYLWEDYTFSFLVKNTTASTINILTRLTRTMDYASCQYEGDEVSIIRIKDSAWSKIAHAKIPNYMIFKPGTYLSASVTDKNVTCLINGRTILNAKVPGISQHGGVGIKIDDFQDSNKLFTSKDISIIKNYPEYENSALNSDQVLLYHFNKRGEYGENEIAIHDYSGSRNKGVASNLYWNRTGGKYADGAFEFTETQSSIKVKDSDSLSPTTFGQQYTVAFWVKFDDTSFKGEGNNENYVNFLGKGSAKSGHEWSFRQYNSSNKEGRDNRISFYAFNPDGGLGAGSYFQNFIREGKWMYITGVLNGTHIKIFRNGVLEDVNPLSEYNITMKNTNSDFYIGKRDEENFFYGSIDELRLYNKSLSDLEVNQLYNLSISRAR